MHVNFRASFVCVAHASSQLKMFVLLPILTLRYASLLCFGTVTAYVTGETIVAAGGVTARL